MNSVKKYLILFQFNINKDDSVRNLSTIEVFINCIVKCKYDNNKNNKEIINICRQVIKYYIKYLAKSADYLAKANLISLMCTWNRIIKNEFTISNKIIESLKTRISDAEEDFERGQIILAIFEYMIQYMNNVKSGISGISGIVKKVQPILKFKRVLFSK